MKLVDLFGIQFNPENFQGKSIPFRPLYVKWRMGDMGKCYASYGSPFIVCEFGVVMLSKEMLVTASCQKHLC